MYVCMMCEQEVLIYLPLSNKKIDTHKYTCILGIHKGQLISEWIFAVLSFGGVLKLRLQILPIIDHLPTSVYIGWHLDNHLPTTLLSTLTCNKFFPYIAFFLEILIFFSLLK
jgi:hypothetical protein